MARSSVFRYKGRDVDPQTVAKELKVQALVTGRIVQRGDQLIISSELIDARTSRNLWANSMTQAFRRAGRTAGKLPAPFQPSCASVCPAKPKAGGQRRHERSEAYQLYLKGLYHWGNARRRHWKKPKTTSIRLLQRTRAMPWRMSAGQLLCRCTRLRALAEDRNSPQGHRGG